MREEMEVSSFWKPGPGKLAQCHLCHILLVTLSFRVDGFQFYLSMGRVAKTCVHL